MPRAGKAGAAGGATGSAGRGRTTGTAGPTGAAGTGESAGYVGAAARSDGRGAAVPYAQGAEAGAEVGAGARPGVAGAVRRSCVGRGGAATRSGSAAGDGVVPRLLIRPPGPASSTVWARVPMKEGFCQVASRPPNPESATPAGPASVARWMGGSDGQAAGTTRAAAPVPPADPEADPDPDAEPEVGPLVPALPASPVTVVSAPPPEAPRSRFRNPMSQLSAPPLVTRDAIWSV